MVITYRGMGRPPAYCAEHDPQKSKTIKRLRQAQERDAKAKGGEIDEAKLEQLGATPSPGLPRALWPFGLAMALSLGLTARDAAEHIALPPLSDAELAALAAEAQTKHADLVARRSSGQARILSTVQGRMSLRLLANIDTIPAHLLPSSIAQISKTLIEQQGGSQPSFGEIRIDVSRL